MTGHPWKHKINIKQYLSERDDRESVVSACAGVLSELKKIERSFKGDDNFEIITLELEGIQDDDDADCADFNNVLSDLYDWADSRRVWMGI